MPAHAGPEELGPLRPEEAGVIDYLLRRHRDPALTLEEHGRSRPEPDAALLAVYRRWADHFASAPRSPISLEFAARLLDRYGESGVLEGEDPGVTAGGTEDRGPPENDPRYVWTRTLDDEGEVILGEVWDSQLERTLTMKRLRPAERAGSPRRDVQAFLREAFITAQLDHPGVLPVHDIGIDSNGDLYFTLSGIGGIELETGLEHARLGRKGWSRGRVLEALLGVCETLAFAHAKGVVHGALEPSSIRVGEFGETIVLDWGRARILQETEEAGPEDGEGEEPGREEKRPSSPRSPYACPESTRGRSALTPASDVYSVGAFLHRYLTGRAPSLAAPGDSGSSSRSTPRNLGGDRGEGPVEDPGRLWKVCERAMAPEMARRPASMAEMAEELRRVLQAEEQSATMAERAKADAERAERVSGFLVDLFKLSDPDVVKGETITAREILDRGAARVAEDFRDEPQIESTLMHTMGIIYHKLGLYPLSQQLLETSLEKRRRMLKDDHPDLIRSSSELAWVCRQNGEIERAEHLFREALQKSLRRYGPQHEETASVLGNLGMVLRSLGRYEEAEEMHRRALEIWRLHQGEGTRVAESLNNLAVVMMHMGRFDEAEPLCRQALDLRIRHGGADDPEVATYQSNLAGLLEKTHQLEEAEELYRASLDLRRRLLGDDHPRVSFTLNGLGHVCRRLGRFEEAESCFRESLRLRRSVGETADVGASLSSLAQLLMEVDRLEEAEELARECLELRRRLLPAGHQSVARDEGVLGSILFERGKREEAEGLLGSCVARRPPLLSRARLALYESLLGRCLAERGAAAEAEPLLRRAVNVLREEGTASLGSPRALRRALAWIVELYEATDRADDAAPYLREIERLSRPSRPAPE